MGKYVKQQLIREVPEPRRTISGTPTVMLASAPLVEPQRHRRMSQLATTAVFFLLTAA